MLIIFKFALAFVATPIIASLLQPLFVRLNLGREKLFVTAAFVSLLIFLLREKYGISLYYSDIIAYVAGAFSGLVFLWLWIEQNIRWLKAVAQNDLFLSEFEIPQEIRLRHLFRFALRIEDEGADFYDNLAATTSREDIKKVCRRISADERSHKRTLEAMISHWAHLPDDEQVMERLQEKMKGRGIFAGPGSTQGGRDVIRYAIAQEQKLLRFYLGFERAFPEAWKRAKIKDIAMMERSHIAELTEILENLTATEGQQA